VLEELANQYRFLRVARISWRFASSFEKIWLRLHSALNGTEGREGRGQINEAEVESELGIGIGLGIGIEWGRVGYGTVIRYGRVSTRPAATSGFVGT